MRQIKEIAVKALIFILVTTGLIALTGCESPAPTGQPFYPSDVLPGTNSAGVPLTASGAASGATNTVDTSTNYGNGSGHSETVILREGDVVKLVFPNTASLNGNHTIDREGNFNLETVGLIHAAGKTIPQLKEAVLAAAANKIDTKEVTVELVTGEFPVYVTGAVFRPGKVLSNHPITALEACMECGGFDYSTANLKNVKISRLENGRYRSFQVNLRDVLTGKSGEPFYLKPQDIIYIRQKFTWF